MTDINNPPETFALTPGEKGSALWGKLRRYLEECNNDDRRKNDSMDLSEQETRNLRAMIAARKSLLDLDQ